VSKFVSPPTKTALCYCRFYDRTFLRTCLQKTGHETDHCDDRASNDVVSWKLGEGWFDVYTGEPVVYNPDKILEPVELELPEEPVVVEPTGPFRNFSPRVREMLEARAKVAAEQEKEGNTQTFQEAVEAAGG